MPVLVSGEPCIDFAELDSTSAEARRRAERGERGPLWRRAERQHAGRGRRGRAWVSEPGNLYASHLAPAARSPAERPQLSLVAAVAVAEALSRLVGPEPAGALAVKWPNDVLAGTGKVAGILLDGDRDWIVTGIGVNLAHAPERLDRPATSLQTAMGVTMTPQEALDPIAAAFARYRAIWQDQGFGPIRAAWLEYGPAIEEWMQVHRDAGGGERVVGRFQGLDATGALLLDDEAGRRRTIAAGEIAPAGEEA